MFGTLLEVELLKNTCRCGTKHVSKLKCAMHTMSGALLEAEPLQKQTPLLHEAHFEGKMNKTHHVWNIFKQLWHETHFEVKMCKTHHVWSTFGS